MKKIIALSVMAVALLVGITACGKKAAVETHTTTGIIREIRSEGRVLVIEHQDFPGFMKAMTMPFELKDPGMSAGLKVGDQVEFSITATDNGYPLTAVKKIGG